MLIINKLGSCKRIINKYKLKLFKMKKLFLRFALLTGLFLVGFAAPALADEKDVYLDLTLKISEYTGAEGGSVAMSGQNVSNPTPTSGWQTTQCIERIGSTKRGKNTYNEVTIYAKPNEGYTFAYWAEADSKTGKPDAAAITEKMIYDGNFGTYIKRWLCANPGTWNETYSAALFRYHVYGTFADYHKDKYTLYAVFAPKEYTVTFKDGSTTVDTKPVLYKKPYGTLPTPEKTGYTFDGWFTEATDGTQVHAVDTYTLTDNQTLFAHWTEQTYTIHFKDEESGSNNNIPNATYSLATAEMPALETATYQLTWDANKYFAGYYTQPNGLGVRVYKGVANGDNLAMGDAFTPTGETTLYAHYSHVHHQMYWDYTFLNANSTEDPKPYVHMTHENSADRIQYARLTFFHADGTAFKNVILHTENPTNKDNTPSAEFDTHTTALADIHLYVGEPTVSGTVINKEDGEHKVYFTDEELADFHSYTFEPIKNTQEGGNYVAHSLWNAATQKETHYTILTYNGATAEHSYTQKWSVKLSGLLINPDIIYVMPLYEDNSSWYAISQLAHTIGVPCAKASEDETGATYEGSFVVWNGYNNAIGLVGFTLGGQTYYMNTEVDHQGEFSPNYNSANPKNGVTVNPGTNNTNNTATIIDMTVPASAIPVIHFQANGGVLSATTPSYLVAAYNATVDLAGYSATRENYTFQGWKTAASEGGQAVTSLTADKAYTLEAQWEGVASTVTLNDNGGEGGLTSVTAKYMEDMPTLTTLPTRTGYDFQGYWDANDKKYYNADGTSANVYDKTDASTLYAGWQAQTYTVTLDHNDAASTTETITATYGEPLADVTVPTWYGHAFLGYFAAKVDTDPDHPATKYFDAEGHCIQAWDKAEGATLYARWELVALELTANQDPLNTADYYTTFYVSNTAYEVTTENVTIFIATQADNGFLYLDDLQGNIIPAGEAVLLQATQDKIHLAPVETNLVKSDENKFEGVDEDTNQDANYTYYVFGTDATYVLGFYKYEWEENGATVKGELKAHKAFFRAANGTPQAAQRRYVLHQTDVTTGMEATTMEKTAVRKMIVNGQLVIEREGKLYNAQGVVIK